ncbi:guanine nucleotide exchange C9orf72 [Aplysia californica]|uniref:Guanine nucleotide exchange C9orf72 n=1 Tax=Aplysia californica TaxID=6500 RepID=A0ABM0K2W1_APLCA|nr:guanine nucleotide exchange C9orf72 [Aplysia californica]XP_035828071.1 guanine nucleotide exchange C9orf72 [Aplysia californica]
MASSRPNQPSSLVTQKSLSSDSGVMTINSEGSYNGLELFEDSALSPVSPSSAFSVSSIGNIEHSFVDALLLCQWDNILGPRLEHVWYVTGRPQPHTNILRFITGQVLSGEICRDVHSSQIDFKFFDIPDKGIIFPAFIFSAQGSNGLALQSLALVIPNSELTLYLHQVDLIHSWMTRIVAKLRVICAMKDFGTSGLADLSSWLWSFMDMLSSLQEVGLPPKIELNYTAFCPAHTLELDFLRLMVSSHLMTFGRSVVMGKHVDRVNVLVYTLGLFCWDSERLCSRAALSGRNWPYYQDLGVQGCIKNADGSFNLAIRDLQCSGYPTTIIDVEHRDVMQSSSATDHRRLRHQALAEELEELYKGHEGYENGPAGTFQNVNAPESLVKDLIDNVHKLPPENGIRESFIRHFMHSLQRRALCLIKHMEGDSSFFSSPTRIATKRLRQDLGLQLEGDFRIVLATADKLKPGLYQFVMGEKKYDNEYLPNMADVL